MSSDRNLVNKYLIFAKFIEWNILLKQNKWNLKKRPLLDDNPELKNLEDKSRYIFRVCDELSAFSKKLDTITSSEYKQESQTM